MLECVVQLNCIVILIKCERYQADLMPQQLLLLIIQEH